MQEMLINSTFFGVLITLLAYNVGVLFKDKFKHVIFNPLLIGIIIVMVILLSFDIEYKVYNEGAKYISYLLTPVTVSLAIPLYEKLELLKKNYKAILLGIASGVLTSLISVFVMSLILGLNHEEYASLLPKSITTAIGMELSREYGGYPSITVAVIVITGIFGNMISEFVCKVFKIEEPIAKGVCIGTSAHAMGTVKATQMGEVEGAMSGLSIAIAGIFTVIGATVFAGLI